jgi:hypothetical protein
MSAPAMVVEPTVGQHRRRSTALGHRHGTRNGRALRARHYYQGVMRYTTLFAWVGCLVCAVTATRSAGGGRSWVVMREGAGRERKATPPPLDGRCGGRRVREQHAAPAHGGGRAIPRRPRALAALPWRGKIDRRGAPRCRARTATIGAHSGAAAHHEVWAGEHTTGRASAVGAGCSDD